MLKVDFWKEGKYFDLWTINHIFYGILAAMLVYYLNISFF